MDVYSLYNAFDEDELLEVGAEAFNDVLVHYKDEDRRYYFAERFIPKLLAHLAVEMGNGNLDELANLYIEQFWDEQHSPRALRESVADNKYDEDR
jgi:hypothetical protein